MNNAIGLGLLLYCALFCGYSLWVKDGAENFVPDQRFYLRLLMSGFGGLSVLIYSNFSMISSVWARMKEWGSSVNPIQPTPPNPLKEKMMKDHEVLAYLKQRIKKMDNERGMELLIELNTLLFSYDEEESDEGKQ
jgi:hypothetical protein